MAHRFEEIYAWLRETKPKVIVEIGTGSGKNACNLMESSGAERYVGFDLWEDADKYVHEIEFNNKEIDDLKDVRKRLKEGGFKFELIQGNTRVTLEDYCKDLSPFADVILIDGGHSTPTIANDFNWSMEMCKTTGVIFLDDYYYGLKNHDVGANRVMGNLHAPY